MKDHLEVKGQEYAINFLNNIIKENEILSIRLIKEFHSLILAPVDPEIAGQFKKFKNKIVGSNFETSDPIFVKEDLEKLLEDYFSSNENIIEKIAKFHTNFEKIHPFSDGTGRLIMNFKLMKAGYPICIIRNEDRLEYYNSLNETQANNYYY
ncbi:Fic family protein [Fusobacterium polymorphum]|uniref:Fic family protein n=1 Tax=Fusobacterium nucleatum subsp. polymorphum TaxID=76857 RepID=UPI00300AA05E